MPWLPNGRGRQFAFTSVSSSARSALRSATRSVSAGTIRPVKFGCADCSCIVDSGTIVVPCGKPDCCCKHLPVKSAL